MERRTFLKTTGGIAAAAAFTSNVLRAASSQIKHIVVVMMENRSFGHFPGWLPNANGKQAGLSYEDVNGVSHPTHGTGPAKRIAFNRCAEVFIGIAVAPMLTVPWPERESTPSGKV